MLSYSLQGNITTAKIVGYKISRNGARKVDNSSSIKSTLNGRSPFFKFITNDNKSITTYSKVLQIFIIFNYQINEEIKIAYKKEKPEQAVILSLKEIPDLVFILFFGILSFVVGKNYLFKNEN